MATLVEILNREIGKIGKSKTYVADKLSVSEKTVENYMRGIRQPKPDALIQLSKILGFDLSELSESFEQDVPHGTKGGRNNQKTFIQKRRELKNSDKATTVAPLIPIKAQAGYARAPDTAAFVETMEKFQLPPGVNHAGAVWSWWEIEGDSMIPALRSGHIILTSQVLFEDWQDIRDETVCIIVTTEEPKIFVKRIYKHGKERWILVSENEKEKGNSQRFIAFSEIKEVWKFRRKLDDEIPPTRRIKLKM